MSRITTRRRPGTDTIVTLSLGVPIMETRSDGAIRFVDPNTVPLTPSMQSDLERFKRNPFLSK